MIIIVFGSLTVFIFLILFIGLQQFPVVPLFGDVQIALVSYLKMCPNFEGMREKWTAAADGADDKVVDQYNLLRRMDSIREEHVKFISELARYRNEVSIVAKPLFPQISAHALIIALPQISVHPLDQKIRQVRLLNKCPPPSPLLHQETLNIWDMRKTCFFCHFICNLLCFNFNSYTDTPLC